MTKFFRKKYIVLLAIFLLTTVIILKNGEELKEGIKISIQEDFKIKESLGQVFLLEKDDNFVNASGDITVTAMALPCNGEVISKEILGDKCIVIDAEMFDGVFATADGVIESIDTNKISIRHSDGKLSSYYGVGCLVKKGESVKKGDTIGYTKGELTFKLYEDCMCLDPLEYISLDNNK